MKTMKPLEAKILYDRIRRKNRGLYVWLIPDENSTLDILDLIETAPFKVFNATELHCTVLHCKQSELPPRINEPKDVVYKSQLTGFQTWQDHKNRTIVVACLDGLADLHKLLTRQGLIHSYADFNPHITIAKDIKLDAEARLWLLKANRFVYRRSQSVVFRSQIMASPAG